MVCPVNIHIDIGISELMKSAMRALRAEFNFMQKRRMAINANEIKSPPKWAFLSDYTKCVLADFYSSCVACTVCFVIPSHATICERR